MTAWVTIPNTDVDAESPLTVALATAWRDNPIAITEGSSGAPKIQTAALEQSGGSEAVTQACVRAAAIGQAELKTSTQEVTETLGNEGSTALSVGEYGLWPTIRVSDTSAVNPIVGVWNTPGTLLSPSASQLPYVYLDGTTTQIWAKFRYVIASPPFDLGDGDIPLFAFALIRKSDGEIVAATTTKVPPWAYNGPTNILPTSYKNNKAHKRVWVSDGDQSEKEIIRLMGLPVIDRIKTKGAWRELEITQGMKNADMNLIPHPYISEDMGAHKVVILDPVGASMETFAAMIDDGESVTEIMTNGTILIDNTDAGRASPPGVMPVSFRFK